MNTLVLLLTVSCTPAAGSAPMMEPAASASCCGEENNCSSCSCGQHRPRFFQRLRNRFHRKSQCCDCCEGCQSAPGNTYGGTVGDGAIGGPGVVLPPGANEGPTFPPMPGASDERTTPGKPLPRGESYLYPAPVLSPPAGQPFPLGSGIEPSFSIEPTFAPEMGQPVGQPIYYEMPRRN